MNLTDIKIGSKIRHKDETVPHEVVEIDAVGNQKIGPCIHADAVGRGIMSFRVIKVSELADWEFVTGEAT